MRIAAYLAGGRHGFGIVIKEAIEPLSSSYSKWEEVVEAALAGKVIRSGEKLKLQGVRLLAPMPRQGRVICIGLNYALHALEGGHTLPDYPAVFIRGADSVVGNRAWLQKPEASDEFDYEGELAVIVGARARNINEADALNYVAGYTCFNDGSLRDFQKKSSQWTMGKNFDASGSLGPWMVTPDELKDPRLGLRISTRLNGKTVQDGRTEDMIFSVPRLIEILSAAMTLVPGDVIATGTPSGVGFARTPPLFMKAGDQCEVEIEGIGVLSNKVLNESALENIQGL